MQIITALTFLAAFLWLVSFGRSLFVIFRGHGQALSVHRLEILGTSIMSLLVLGFLIFRVLPGIQLTSELAVFMLIWVPLIFIGKWVILMTNGIFFKKKWA